MEENIRKMDMRRRAKENKDKGYEEREREG